MLLNRTLYSLWEISKALYNDNGFCSFSFHACKRGKTRVAIFPYKYIYIYPECMYGYVHTYICIYTYIRERNGGSDKSTMEKLFLILIRDQTEIFIIDPKIKLTSKIFCKHYSVFSFIYLVIGWQQTCWWLVYTYLYIYV